MLLELFQRAGRFWKVYNGRPPVLHGGDLRKPGKAGAFEVSIVFGGRAAQGLLGRRKRFQG
jgi:hypothetical protein